MTWTGGVTATISVTMPRWPEEEDWDGVAEVEDWRHWHIVLLTPRGQAAGAQRRQLARPLFDWSIRGCGGL